MPKLPADLPENWTRGQIVSPNGTETGLTEQHGYNYLMKQVNNTQTEVNNINDALTDVAQQVTVKEINNKIGTEADADTQPTLFGRLAQLKNVLLEKLAEVLTKVTGIDGKIGTNEDTAGTATLFGQLFQIKKDTKDTEMYVLSNTLQKTILSKELSATDTAATFLGSFYAEKTGLIFVEANMKKGSGTRDAVIVPISTEDMYYTTKSGGEISFSSTLNETVEGLTQMPNQGDSIYGSYVSSALDLNYTTSSKILYCNKTSYASRKHAMSVRKGNLYLFFLTNSGFAGQTVYCNSLKLYYDVKEVNEI